MEQEYTPEQIIEFTINLLNGIKIPVMLLNGDKIPVMLSESVGTPVYQAIGNLNVLASIIRETREKIEKEQQKEGVTEDGNKHN